MPRKIYIPLELMILVQPYLSVVKPNFILHPFHSLHHRFYHTAVRN